MKKIAFIIALSLQPALLFAGRSVDELQKKLAEIPPEHNYRARAVLLSELGTQLYRDGRMNEAIQAFDDSLGYGPPTMLKKHIYLYMGKSYESVDRLDKAISAYEQAALLDRKNWRRHRDLAGLYERVNLLDKAVSSYKKALKYNPKEPSVNFSLGRVYRELYSYEQAENHFVTAIDQGYNQTDVFGELSLVFEAQGKFAESASSCSETLSDNSPAEDWARLIYLSLLGRQDDLTQKGFAGLKKKNPGTETIRFYEALKRYMDGNKNIDNAALAALFKDVLQ